VNEELLQRLEREAEKTTLDMPASLDDLELTAVFNLEFARLIVRECLAQSDKMRDSLEQDGENKQALGADWVGLAIAKHFGVE
jgi:hypothetical protein